MGTVIVTVIGTGTEGTEMMTEMGTVTVMFTKTGARIDLNGETGTQM